EQRFGGRPPARAGGALSAAREAGARARHSCRRVGAAAARAAARDACVGVQHPCGNRAGVGAPGGSNRRGERGLSPGVVRRSTVCPRRGARTQPKHAQALRREGANDRERELAMKNTNTGDVLRCSFCNKSQKHVKKLIAGPTAYICDECVDICLDIIAEDRDLVDVSTGEQVPKGLIEAADRITPGHTETKRLLAA